MHNIVCAGQVGGILLQVTVGKAPQLEAMTVNDSGWATTDDSCRSGIERRIAVWE